MTMNHPAQPAPEGAKRRPILMGQAIEIPNPNITPEVQSVLDNEGLYIGGDSKAPDHVIIPLWSQDGIVRSMKLDAPLDPERFLETVTFKGPYTPQSASPQESAALRARCERLEGALTRCATEADTFRAQHWPRICALIAKDNKCAMADIAYPVCLSSIGQLAGAALAQPEAGK